MVGLVVVNKDVAAGLYTAFERCMGFSRGMGDQLAIRVERCATDQAIPRFGRQSYVGRRPSALYQPDRGGLFIKF